MYNMPKKIYANPSNKNHFNGSWADNTDLTETTYYRHDLYETIEAQNKMLAESVTSIKAKVDAQADDEGLWFYAKTASEGYLQQELRKLHEVIENHAEAIALAQKLIDELTTATKKEGV